MKNYININSNLTTNFKPNAITNFCDFKLFKKNKTQIFCKNFFIYILLLKFKKKIFKKSNIFVKKNKTKVFTILRSPYRHKLARHQIALNRYCINISIKINISKYFLTNNWKKCVHLFNFFKKFNNVFESNLIFLTSFSTTFPVIYTQNFLIIKNNN